MSPCLPFCFSFFVFTFLTSSSLTSSFPELRDMLVCACKNASNPAAPAKPPRRNVPPRHTLRRSARKINRNCRPCMTLRVILRTPARNHVLLCVVSPSWSGVDGPKTAEIAGFQPLFAPFPSLPQASKTAKNCAGLDRNRRSGTLRNQGIMSPYWLWLDGGS